MKYFWILCSVLLASAGARPASGCDRSPLLLREVRIWTPAGLGPRQDLLIVDGRVMQVSAQIAKQKDTRTIHARGATLLPGLIDSHLHLSYAGWRASKPGDHRWGAAAFTGPQTISAGVTNARIHLIDLTTGAMLRADSQDDCAPLPRLQSAGPAFIPGSPKHHNSVVWSVNDAADAAARVRLEKAAGFDWIAFHEMHNFMADERAAIVQTARKNGLRLLASGYTQEDLRSSLDARPDTIDYIDTSPAAEYDASLLATAREQRGLTWVARLGVHLRRDVYERDLARVTAPIHYAFFPSSEVDALKRAALEDLANRDSDYSKRMTAAFPTLQRKFQQLRESGIPLAAGTDAGSPVHSQSDAIWWELKAWVRFGATPAEALTAVTVNGARVLNRTDLGHLRPGAVGDFVLYAGDVETGDFDVSRVTHVSKGGVLYVEDGKWIGPDPP